MRHRAVKWLTVPPGHDGFYDLTLDGEFLPDRLVGKLCADVGAVSALRGPVKGRTLRGSRGTVRTEAPIYSAQNYGRGQDCPTCENRRYAGVTGAG